MSAQLKAGKRRKYDPVQMSRAVDAARGGMSKKLAAKTFNVPRTTLLDKLTGKYQLKYLLAGNRSLHIVMKSLFVIMKS